MRGCRGGDHRDAELQERNFGFASNTDHQRREDQESNLVKHRQAEYQANDHDCPLYFFRPEALQQSRGNTLGRAGIDHQLTEDRTEQNN